MSKLTLQQAIEQALPKLREKRQRDMEAALKNANTEDLTRRCEKSWKRIAQSRFRRQLRNEEEFRKSEFRADVEKFRMLTGSRGLPVVLGRVRSLSSSAACATRRRKPVASAH